MFKFCISVTVILTASAIASENDETTSGEVLGHYRDSLTWMQSVSMQVDVRMETNGLPDVNGDVFYSEAHFVHRRDSRRCEWIGKNLVFNAGGQLLGKGMTIQEIFADGKYVNVYGPVGAPRYATISRDYAQSFEDLYEAPRLIGPLAGRIFGNKHFSIADLLGSAPNLRLMTEKESIRGSLCYVIEGVTRYGRVAAWIAPDKGFNALKWTIEKEPNDLFDDNVLFVQKWLAEFELFEVQEVNGVILPKNACFTLTIEPFGSRSEIGLYKYQVTQVSLNPDFDTLGAFKIDLPNRTRVYFTEASGVQYIWQDGNIVPDVEGPAFEEIDRMIEGLKGQQ